MQAAHAPLEAEQELDEIHDIPPIICDDGSIGNKAVQATEFAVTLRLAAAEARRPFGDHVVIDLPEQHLAGLHLLAGRQLVQFSLCIH